MAANLITPFEVLKYSSAGSDYPTAQFCELIPQVEAEFARECLGSTLYDYLVSKLTDYPDAEEWDAAATYAEGDVVIRSGCLYVSQEAANGDDPLDGTTKWEAFERFNDAGAMLLWIGWLRRILALKVWSASLVFQTWRSGPSGLVINEGDRGGFRAANKGEMSDVKAGILAEIERTTANMLAWLSVNAVEYSLPTATACQNGCATPGRRSRRWMFKV